MQYIYNARLEKDPDGGFFVSFADIPEALASGKTKEAALAEAALALGQGLRTYAERGIAMPAPKAKAGVPIGLSTQDSLKLATLDAFVEAGISKTELAARLGKKEGEARRILDPDHTTKAATLDAALKVLGKRAVISFEAA